MSTYQQKIVCPIIGLLIFLSTPTAKADPIETTRYSYYTISGNSPVAIHNALVRQGPVFGHDKAYATTSAITRQSGSLIQGKGCQVRNYKIIVNFTIKLPQLRASKSLSATEVKLWASFSDYLKRHEEKHRTIWLSCARRYESKIINSHARSCKDLAALSSKLWAKEKQSCEKQHSAYDTAEQRNILHQPFMRHVINQLSDNPHTDKSRKKRNP